jgi:hypothetical protein
VPKSLIIALAQRLSQNNSTKYSGTPFAIAIAVPKARALEKFNIRISFTLVPHLGWQLRYRKRLPKKTPKPRLI